MTLIDLWGSSCVKPTPSQGTRPKRGLSPVRTSSLNTGIAISLYGVRSSVGRPNLVS